MNNSIPIQHICFDLDGTITDSINTIYQTTIKTLEMLNIHHNLTFKEFNKIVGYHFKDMFLAFKIPVTDFEQYMTFYQSHYFAFINQSRLYPGVIETLQYLKDKGIKTSLCTTKLQNQADKVIDYFKLRNYFSFILGRRENIESKPSGKPLLFICSELNVSPEASLIVGDTELDIRCGKNAGAKTCAASYGYRDLKSIKEENPDFIINEITELINLAVRFSN
jgi:phosphoglycolate phosphatase/pyrophosphatase PpaX